MNGITGETGAAERRDFLAMNGYAHDGDPARQPREEPEPDRGRPWGLYAAAATWLVAAPAMWLLNAYLTITVGRAMGWLP
jgi:hypothetical protein